MLRKQELMEIVSDTRLTPGAVRVVLDVALRGHGEHEIATSRFAALLNHPGEKKVRSEVALCVEFGYLSRRRGGRGKHDFYSYNPAVSAGLSDADPDYNPAPTAGLSAGDVNYNPATGAGLSDNPAKIAGLKPPHAGPPHSRADFEPLTDGSEVGREEPPVVPLSELSGDAALEQHSEILHGCRKPLRAYYMARFPDDGPRQASYVHSVVCMLDDPITYFRAPTGETAPAEEQRQILAIAFNQLLQTGETGPNGPLRYPWGDIRNLRTTISILLKERHNGPSNGRTAGGSAPSPRGAPAAAGIAGAGSQDHRRRRKHGSAG